VRAGDPAGSTDQNGRVARIRAEDHCLEVRPGAKRQLNVLRHVSCQRGISDPDADTVVGAKSPAIAVCSHIGKNAAGGGLNRYPVT